MMTGRRDALTNPVVTDRTSGLEIAAYYDEEIGLIGRFYLQVCIFN
jgi:hypothetical protein